MEINSMESAIDKFHNDGYLLVEPGVIFSDDEIQKILERFNTLLPEWNEGFIDPKKNDCLNAELWILKSRG